MDAAAPIRTIRSIKKFTSRSVEKGDIFEVLDAVKRIFAVLALSMSVICTVYSEQPAGGNKAGRPAKKPVATFTAKLAGRVDLVLSDMDVRAAVRHIGDITGVNMVIDQRAINEIQRRGGIVNVDIRLKDVPLKQAMAVMLRSVGLDFAVYDYFIFISTPDRIRHESLDNLKTRVYSLKSAGSQSLPKVLVLDPSSMTKSIATPLMPVTNRR